MTMLVSMGAGLMCTMGVSPSSLVVLPVNRSFSPLPLASIMDFAPIVNIPTFGMCNSMANPVVAAATAAKLGVFTPMPCVPATVAPWAPGSPKSLLGVFPALTSTSKCMCMWGGVISITAPGQTTVTG